MVKFGVKSWVADFVASVRMLRAFSLYVWPHRWRIAFQIAFGIVNSAIMAVTPLVAKFVFDEIIAKKNLSLFIIFAIAYMSAFLATRALGILHGYVSMYVKMKVDYRLRLAFMNHLGASPPNVASNVSTGEHLHSFTSDISKVNGLITSIAQEVVGSLTGLVIACVVMLHIDWRVALPVICLTPVTISVRLIATTFVKKQSEEARALDRQTSRVLCESVAMMPLARLLAHERALIHQYVTCLKEKIKLSIRHWQVRRWLDQMQWLIESGPGTAVSCYVWISVLLGKQTIGSAVAFSMYINMIIPPILSCLGIHQKLVVGLVAGERVLEFLRQPKESGRGLPSVPKLPHAPSVRFEHVSFAYDAERLVLEDMTFSVPSGSLCVLMGPSGIGKSTIIKLICRLYLPQSGAVYLDSHSLHEVNPRSVRRQISIVPQETDVFTGTIRENLLFGNPGLSDEQLFWAAERACALEFIRTLRDGFDTVVHSEQTELSAGQKQRLILARTFCAHRRLLLLDEPFANIDSSTQRVLWENLSTLRQQNTILLVTHSDPPAELLDRCFWFDAAGLTARADGRRPPRNDGGLEWVSAEHDARFSR